MTTPTAPRDLTEVRNGYSIISLANAVFFGTATMLLFPSRPLLPYPVALAAFVLTFAMLCMVCGGGER